MKLIVQDNYETPRLLVLIFLLWYERKLEKRHLRLAAHD